MHQALSADGIAEAAALLRRAQSDGTPCPPIRQSHDGATIDDAYAIQLANTEWRERGGATVVGAKIGLTAKAVQKQLGVDQPDFGLLFNDMAVASGDVIEWGRVLQPKVEAEVAFVMARTPDPARLTVGELIDSVAYALPAIEIVGSRIANWDISIVDTIADNASSGAFVLGTRPIHLDDVDLRLCGMVVEKNGEGVSFGAGAACLGHPLNALGWLAAKMAEVGRPLQAGDIVLSGALGPMAAVAPGDDVEARIEGLGTVKVRFGREATA
jgi:2-keto-4-pentenoate hydratase